MNEPAHTYPNVLQSFKITGIVIGGLILMSPVKMLLDNMIDKELSSIIYYLLGVGIPFWVVFSTRKNKTGDQSFSLVLESKRVISLLVIGTTVLHFGMIAPLAYLVPNPEIINKGLIEAVSQKGIFTLVLMVMAAPVLEELIFRGIILDGLLKIYTPLKSILISSLLFGLIHLNPSQIVGAFMFGIFTGWVYHRTRNLLLTIIIHAVANLGAFLLRYFVDIESSIDDTLVEWYGGVANLITAVGGSTIIFVVCVYYLKKEFIKEDMKDGATQRGF